MSKRNQEPKAERDRAESSAHHIDLDLVALIARTLKDSLPSMPMDLSMRYAQKIVIALYRERYLPEHTL
jgi:hypothetical protein